MKRTFGPFVLDEDGRELQLSGAPLDVQPRVFDLIAFLVANAGRVVPKDELLDAIWPGVVVTEASLQRAASLARKLLKTGGMESALRSFARRGYRFAIDDPSLGDLLVEAGDDDTLAAARNAAAGRDWAGASRLFAATKTLSAEDCELWALADECRGRPVDAVPALLRAIDLYLEAGKPAQAARAAVRLAKVELERGASATAEGWVERAASILGPVNDASAAAFLLWMRARLAGSAGAPEQALEFATRATELAEAGGEEGLRALTLAYRGFYAMSLGQLAEGTRQQNHAAAIALSGRVDPITGSLVYCNILWSCRMFQDWERALQWSDGFESWCDASFAENPGSCDLHRAEVLGARAPLNEAHEKISAALPKLVDEQSWSLGEGHRVRGDIAAMMGNLEQAEADYAAAYALDWDAEPGNAVLLAERGEADAALRALDRALQGTSWHALQRRGVLLANAARIAAKSKQTARAKRYLAAVNEAEDRWPQATVRALVAEANAALLPEEDTESMRLRLLARQLWTGAKFDYHATRMRLEIAQVHLATGDIAGAQSELAAALHTAQRLGSKRLLTACANLREQLPSQISTKDQHQISAR